MIIRRNKVDSQFIVTLWKSFCQSFRVATRVHNRTRKEEQREGVRNFWIFETGRKVEQY